MRLLPILLAAAVAQAPSVQQPSASIQGLVTRAGTTEPIRNAIVTLNQTRGTAVLQAYTTTTGTDGSFAFPDLQPGEYRIVATRDGYLRAEFGQAKPNGRGISVQVAAGQIKGVQLSMVATSVIYGHVSDRDRDPLVNVTVQALKRIYQDGRPHWTIVQSTQTNDLGEYRLIGLPPGQYYVGAFKEPQVIPAGLANRIIAPSIGYLPVYFGNSADLQTASTIDVSSGGSIGGVDLALVMEPMRRIRGSVMNAKTGQLIATGIALVPRNSNGNIKAIRSASSSNGEFNIENVLPGAYYLIAAEETKEGMLSGRVPIDISAADIENVTVVVARGPDFSAHASIDGSLDNPDIRHLRINLIPDPSLPGQEGISLAFEPDANGSFAMESVPFGDYRIVVSRLPENTYLKSIRMDSTDLRIAPFHVDADVRGAVEIVLGTNPGSIEGNILNGNGEPVPYVTVALIPSEPNRNRTDLYRGASTNESGRFGFQDVPPGEYKLLTWDDLEDGAWQDPELIRRYEYRAKPIHIEEGNKQSIELRIGPMER